MRIVTVVLVLVFMGLLAYVVGMVLTNSDWEDQNIIAREDEENWKWVQDGWDTDEL